MANTQSVILNPQPYGSFLVAHASTNWIPSDISILTKESLKLVKRKVEDGDGKVGKTSEIPLQNIAGLNIIGLHLSTSTPCKWDPQLFDKTNELILICHQNSYVAIYCSNSEHRRAISSVIGKSAAATNYQKLSSLKKISAAHLTSAFLENEQLKAMWLAGTHKSVQVKADSKVLSGKDLKYALDPLGDSTYLAAAARSSTAGVSLKGSGIWTKPYSSLTEFATGASAVLAKISAKSGQNAVLPVLANELHTFSGVGSAFDFELAPIEILKSSSDQQLVSNIVDHVDFSLVPFLGLPCPAGGFGLKVSDISSALTPTPSISHDIEPKFSTTSPTELEFSINLPAGGASGNSEWIAKAVTMLQERADLFRVFYDSGHTISAGHLAVSVPKDRNFTGWKWVDFTKPMSGGIVAPVSVDKEKPNGNDLSLIWTDPNEDSLFSWFISTVSDPVSSSSLGLPQLNSNLNDVWVFCDDDAGEVADFVHIHVPNNAPPKICLVHIKGARSASANREMVAGPFEVVCGQAVKNVRYIDAEMIRGRIGHRIQDPQRPIWNAPNVIGQSPAGCRNTFAGVLSNIGANAKYQIIVVQPQVTASAFAKPRNAVGAANPLLGAIQLRSLLFGAENSCRAVGAEFFVTGAN